MALINISKTDVFNGAMGGRTTLLDKELAYGFTSDFLDSHLEPFFGDEFPAAYGPLVPWSRADVYAVDFAVFGEVFQGRRGQ